MGHSERFVDGVNVCGYLRGEIGLGGAARGYVAALRHLGMPLALNDVTQIVPGLPGRAADVGQTTADNPYRVNLISVPAQDHEKVVRRLGDAYLQGHYNIGIWVWELPEFPREFHRLFSAYDEIWTGSTFVAKALSPVSPVPIIPILPPIVPPRGDRARGRARIGANGETVFVFVFDFWGIAERKNALAVIEAFNRAFRPADPARLIIKSANGASDPAYLARMRERADSDRIALFDGYWETEAVHDLMAACDVYVSLHRSEGTGLTMLEAMSLGKPVIATGWSGNMDFMSVGNSFPVRFDLVPLEQTFGPYRAGQIWAEPSIEHAAELMRRCVEDEAAAARVGEEAARYVANFFSAAAIADVVQKRLEVVASTCRARWPERSTPPVDAQLKPARDGLGSAPTAAPAPGQDDTGRIGAVSIVDVPHERVETDLGPLLIHAHDTVVSVQLRRLRTWDPAEGRLLRRLVEPGMTALDVGANIGYFTVLLAQLVGPHGQVVAVEPEPRNFALLQANLALHGFDSVATLQIAAADTEGEVLISLSQDNLGDHRAFGNDRGGGTVATRSARLDDVLDPNAKVDVVKIDTQGMDHVVIRGLHETIERSRPQMLVEFFPEGITDAGESPLEVLRFYRELGFELTVLSDAPYMLDAEQDSRFLERLVSSKMVDPHVNLLLQPIPPRGSIPPVVLRRTDAAVLDAAARSLPTGAVRPSAAARANDLDHTSLDEASLVLVATDAGEIWTDARDTTIGHLLRTKGSNEPSEGAFLRGLLKPGMNVIDVGANIGYFTLMMAQSVGPTGRVIALEPEPKNFALLRKNLEHADAKNVTALRLAAGAGRERRKMAVEPTRHGGHHLVAETVLTAGDAEPSTFVDVDTVPLDELNEPATPIHFVKIDIEGFDHLAVQGLQRTLRDHDPVIFVEFYPEAIRRAGGNPIEVLRVYRDMGLGIAHELAPDEPLALPDADFVRDVERGRMYGRAQRHTNLVLRKLPRVTSAPKLKYVVAEGIRQLPETSWRPVFQRSVDAFHEGKIDEGAEACRTLLNAVGLPDRIRELTFRNQYWYARPLQEVVPRSVWQPLSASVPEAWTALDPSPASDGNRLLVVMRSAPDGGTRETTSELGPPAPFDGAEIVTVAEVAEDGRRRTELRPFFDNGALHIAAVLRPPGEPAHASAGVLRLSAGAAIEMGELGPRPGNFRQGWSPVATQEGPRFVAWWEPTEVFRFNAEAGEFERVAMRMAPHIAERFQGGSQGVPVPGGYLFLVNESVILKNGVEVTFSRFVRVDDGFQITDISPQFFLEQRGNDVASGLARQGDRLIAGFTAGRHKALLATMELAAAVAALQPVGVPGPHR